MSKQLRNLAIVAHVDHGKTTLVDKLLRQTNTLEGKDQWVERIMDSNNLEKERGITIFAKHASVQWKDCLINLIDTPGHADFGGEVERVLSMADGFLLLVDAADGPMPQTRFVTQKAFAKGLAPLVVINKVDRPSARPEWVLEQTFELFMELGASDAQLNFPVIYASALQGKAGRSEDQLADDLSPLLEAIVQYLPPAQGNAELPCQLQISQLDYSPYTGSIGIGRLTQGSLQVPTQLAIVHPSDPSKVRQVRLELLYRQAGLQREAISEAKAGEIVAVSGIGELAISDTLCSPSHPVPLPALQVDEPTVSVKIFVNSSPFAGKDGKLLTSRQIGERLEKEKRHNVALQVEPADEADSFLVSGRGELHLSILIETMRREGFELSVARPHVIFRRNANGELQEPFEELLIDLPAEHQGPVMASLGERRAILLDMAPDAQGRVRLTYQIPSRGLMGFRSQFITLTSGNGIMCSRFTGYKAKVDVEFNARTNGVLISNGMGKALAYALFHLQPRGKLMIGHAEDVYEGQIIGIHSRENDLTVNCLQGKKLSNVRAAGKDTAIILSPPIRLTLEQALEFIEEDELLEVTPNHLRLRKKYLTESERKRPPRSA